MFEEEKQPKGGEKTETRDFDIVWMIKYFWANRKRVAIVTCASVVVSLIVFMCKDKVFTSEAVVLPTSSEASGAGSLSSLASLAGVKIGGTSSGQLSPELFGQVATSTTSLLRIMNEPLTWTEPDTVESLYSRMKRDTIPTVGKLIMKYTIGLPQTIKVAVSGLDAKEEEVVLPSEDDDDTKPLVLNKAMNLCIKELTERISVVYDDDHNLLTVSCTAPNAKQSSELIAIVLNQIQTSVTEFATRNARKNLEFAQEQYDKALADYSTKREKWFRYKDTHRGIVEERSDLAQNELQEEYNLAYNLLTSLQQQVETCKLELASKTPAFSVVEPIVTPLKKSAPKGSLHILAGIVIGILLSVGGMLVVLGYKQVFDPESYNAIYDKYYQA